MAYTIMIIDDSETIRAMLERSLKMTNLPVESIIKATNGKDALELLDSNWTDIIFTDINMPQMNGIELIDILQESNEYKNIPIIIISTEGSISRIEQLMNKGVKGYIRKPFTPEQIRDKIINTLGEW